MYEGTRFIYKQKETTTDERVPKEKDEIVETEREEERVSNGSETQGENERERREENERERREEDGDEDVIMIGGGEDDSEEESEEEGKSDGSIAVKIPLGGGKIEGIELWYGRGSLDVAGKSPNRIRMEVEN